MTECSGGSWSPDWAGNLLWNQQNLFIGGVNAWSTSVLLWNMFLDEHNGPHCEGGACCTGCRPVITVPSNASAATDLLRHEEYLGLAHHSAFVLPGARRVSATVQAARASQPNQGAAQDVIAVAYASAGQTTLVVANSQQGNVSLVVDMGNNTPGQKNSFRFVLPRGVATFVW